MAAEGVHVELDSLLLRSIALRHFMPPRTPSPLHAAGSNGSRFVPAGRSYPSLYAAFDAETAHREGNQPFYAVLARGVGPGGLNPPEEAVMIGVRFKLGRILDLRDREIQARLGTSAEELAGGWKLVPDAPTQILGDAVHASGDFEGLLYSAVRNPGGTCLVVFPDRLIEGSIVDFRSRTPGVPSARLAPG